MSFRRFSVSFSSIISDLTLSESPRTSGSHRSPDISSLRFSSLSIVFSTESFPLFFVPCRSCCVPRLRPLLFLRPLCRRIVRLSADLIAAGGCSALFSMNQGSCPDSRSCPSLSQDPLHKSSRNVLSCETIVIVPPYSSRALEELLVAWSVIGRFVRISRFDSEQYFQRPHRDFPPGTGMGMYVFTGKRNAPRRFRFPLRASWTGVVYLLPYRHGIVQVLCALLRKYAFFTLRP